jgi:hypothetical protein
VKLTYPNKKYLFEITLAAVAICLQVVKNGNLYCIYPVPGEAGVVCEKRRFSYMGKREKGQDGSTLRHG